MTGGTVCFEMVPLNTRYMLNWLTEVVKGQADKSGLCDDLTMAISAQRTLQGSDPAHESYVVPKSPHHPAHPSSPSRLWHTAPCLPVQMAQ